MKNWRARARIPPPPTQSHAVTPRPPRRSSSRASTARSCDAVLCSTPLQPLLSAHLHGVVPSSLPHPCVDLRPRRLASLLLTTSAMPSPLSRLCRSHHRAALSIDLTSCRCKEIQKKERDDAG
jgi:hypothetical protein